MSKELDTTQEDRGLHKDGEFTKYSDDQRAQLRALGGLDEASDADLDMLAAFSDRTGLDPFTKEVYLVGRKTKVGGYRGEPERWETRWTVQTGIDGFRKVTHRVAQQRGEPVTIGQPTFYDHNGNEHPIWLKAWGNPAAAKTEVRIGDSVGVGIATWDEYVQTTKSGQPNAMWSRMGPSMLAKCSESQAHRRVTPLTAGMYVPEEMMQADDQPVRMKATRVQTGTPAVDTAPQNTEPEELSPAAQEIFVKVNELESKPEARDVWVEANDLDATEQAFIQQKITEKLPRLTDEQIITPGEE